jgi:hypothetical protein
MNIEKIFNLNSIAHSTSLDFLSNKIVLLFLISMLSIEIYKLFNYYIIIFNNRLASFIGKVIRSLTKKAGKILSGVGKLVFWGAKFIDKIKTSNSFRAFLVFILILIDIVYLHLF